ncbi:MAG: PaaI family thioesterase [Promethearchaeota archaeon]
MTSDLHYRQLEQLYLNANCNQYYSPSIQISEGSAEIRIKVQEKYFHALGAVHGAVYFKVLDDAAFFAANSVIPDKWVLTANFSLYLIRPITSGEIRAVGRVVNKGKTQIIAESVAYNSKGEKIASGSGTFVISQLKLSNYMNEK